MLHNNPIPPTGRPSKLEQVLVQAKRYLHGGYLENEKIIPTLAGLASYTTISRSTLYEYKKQSEAFSDMFEAILALQESKLINKGLLGEFNPTITKLMLANHGYRNKVKQELTNNSQQAPALTIVMSECISDLTDQELDLHEKLELLRGELPNQQSVFTISKKL